MAEFHVYVADLAVKKAFEDNVRKGIYQDHNVLDTTKLLIRQLLERNPNYINDIYDYVYPKYRKYYGVGRKQNGMLK